VFRQATDLEIVGLSGTWHLAARHVSPGGLGRFLLAVLRLRQAVWADLCNDVILGSEDVVPGAGRFMDGGEHVMI